jgi:L-aspartate oxidase
VFGSRAAEDIVAGLDREGPRPLEVPPVSAPGRGDGHARIDISDVRESLRALLWRRMGITRDAAGLAEAADRVDRWSRYILPLEFDGPEGWTLQNMLLVARLMIAAASARRESRGVHYRRDFPKPDPGLNRHLTAVPGAQISGR